MARSTTTPQNKNAYNETKRALLNLFHPLPPKHLSLSDIKEKIDIPEGGIRRALTANYKWGYIWRRQDPTKRKNRYAYRYLKPKGLRVLKELNRRKEIETTTGIEISLNLKKPIPLAAIKLYNKIASKTK